MQRGFIPIIVVAGLLLIVGVGAVVVSQSASQPTILPAQNEQSNTGQTNTSQTDLGEEKNVGNEATQQVTGNDDSKNLEDATDGTTVETSANNAGPNGSVSATTAAPAVESKAVFVKPSIDYSLDFCSRVTKTTQQVKANMSPSDYIAASSNTHYLSLWKELFLKRNGITEEYFDKYIRIELESVVEPSKEDEGYFSIKYYFLVDWFSVPLYDAFTTKSKSGVLLSDDEIRELFAQSWGNPDETSYYSEDQKHFLGIHTNVVSSIAPHGKIVTTIQSCADMLSDVEQKNSKLYVSDLDYHDMSFQILTYVPAEYDASYNLVDPEQKCPFGIYDIVAEEFVSYDAELGCGMP